MPSCPCVLACDAVESPAVHVFLPSMYHHFINNGVPWGFSNSGILDLRLVVSRDSYNLSYSGATDPRSPFVPLGISDCQHSTPSTPGGWCNPFSGEEKRTSFDTSVMYAASGYVPSTDGHHLYFYASGQPETHGGYSKTNSTEQQFGHNTGIRSLKIRRDGFVSVTAAYNAQLDVDHHASFTTVAITVPYSCGPPTTRQLPHITGARKPKTDCSYAHSSCLRRKWPPYLPIPKLLWQTIWGEYV